MERLRLMFCHGPIIGIVLAIVVGIVIVAWAGNPWLRALVLVGIPLQMLNECNLHRFIFHLPPPRRQWQFGILCRAHYGHHDFPTNRYLFFAPDFVAFPVLAFNFTLVWSVLMLLGAGWAFAGTGAIVMVGAARA